MVTLHFSEGKELQLGYRLLKILAENLPDTEEYTELGQALLDLGIPSITQELVGNPIMSKAQYDTMWEAGNLEVRRKLVDEKKFLKNLTDAQAKDIITLNDTQMLESIAEWAELFYPEKNDSKQAARLSGSMADAVLTHISTHSDSSVRAALVRNTSAPAKFLPPVRLCIEQGMSRHIRLAGMTADDSQALSHASLETIIYVAENIEEILDKNVRRTVATALIEYPDPSVRLALAENSSAPAYAVKALLNDPDIDVAAAARRELNDRDEEKEFD